MMNENEKMNGTDLTETAYAPEEAASALPTGTDTPAPAEMPEATVCEPAEADEPAEAATGEAEALAAESSAAEPDRNAAVEIAAVAPASGEDGPETLLDRILDVLYAAWDGFLDLMIALHILEEALPEQADPAVTASPAPVSGNGILHVDCASEAPLLPALSGPEPLPLAG